MFDPSGDEPKTLESRYALVMAVAKRAKQIRDGAPKLVDIKSKNPITVALEEISTGKLKIVVPTAEELEAAGKLAASIRQEPLEAVDLLRITEPDETDEEDALSPSGLDRDILNDLSSVLGDLGVDDDEEVEHEDEEDSETVSSEDALGLYVDEDTHEEGEGDDLDADEQEE